MGGIVQTSSLESLRKPLLLCQYPTALQYKKALRGIEKALAAKLLEHMTKLHNLASVGKYKLKGKPQGRSYHASASILRNELEDVENMLDRYLSVEDIGITTQFQLATTPSFRSIATSGFFQIAGGVIEACEARLTTKKLTNQEAGRVITEPEGEYTTALFGEFVAWDLIVRLSITISMVNALDYDAIWRKLDGDAGWFLSGRVEELYCHLQGTAAYRIVSVNTLKEFLGYPHQLFEPIKGHILSIGAAIKLQQQWRLGCTAQDCSVASLGVTHPWEFAPIDRSLYDLEASNGNAGQGSTAAPPWAHMYARSEAQRRILLARRIWTVLREHLIRTGRVQNPKGYQLIVTAANLRYGGKHPPHATHQDGSMFDVWLTHLPHLVKRAQPQLIFEIAQYPEEWDVVDDDMGEQPPKVTQRVRRTEEWDVPPGKLLEELSLVFRALTKCIYLSIPSSVLLASDKVTLGAHEELLGRIEELMESDQPSAEAETSPSVSPNQRGPNTETEMSRLDALQLLRELVTRIKPVPFVHQSVEKQEHTRSQHRHHWHINYNPRWLGPEPPVPLFSRDEQSKIRQVPVDQAQDHVAKIQMILRFMEQHEEMWIELLQEPAYLEFPE